MKKSLMLVVTLGIMASAYVAHAEDAVDSQMHNAVSNKVQQDHQADMKAGAVTAKKSGSNSKTSSNAGSSNASAGKATTAAAPAQHPMQINDLKKKKAAPPKPSTGHH
jgi:hypothetical protein